MALSAAKTFVAAEVLFASDLNALNTNILNNALSLISPLTGNLDVDGNALVDIGEVEFRDAAANPSASSRFRRNGSQLIYAVEDARTNTTLRPFVIQATTSGTPAASLGVGQLYRGESGDENPAEFGALDFIATDVGAGTEDTVLGILLRIAGGAALVEAFRLQATGAFLATITHALTAARTFTLPDATTTFVGTDTTQTLTNKTWNGVAIATQYGGTGQNFSATAQGNILYFSASGILAALAPGTSGQVLQSGGAGANPSWATSSSTYSQAADVTTEQTTTSTTYTDLVTSGPAVTMSPGSTATHIISVSSDLYNSTASNTGFASVAVAGATALDADALSTAGASSSLIIRAGRLTRAASVANAATHTMKYRTTAGTETYINRRIVAWVA